MTRQTGESGPPSLDPERMRLNADQQRVKNWKRWGPYLGGASMGHGA